MVALEGLTAIALAFAIVTTVTTIAAHAQQRSFYGPNGSFAGSSSTHGNSTSFYGPRGNFSGSSITHGNTTTFYGPRGNYEGTATTTSPGSPSTNRSK